MLGDIPEVRVGYHRDFLDVLLMILDEAKVSDQRSETVPAGELRGVDNESGKLASRLDKGVDRLRQLDKISCVERRLRSHQQDGMCGIEIKFDHGLLLNGVCRMDKRGWVFKSSRAPNGARSLQL